MSNQDNINSFLDSMDNFDCTPAEEAPTPLSVPFTPAAVWPGEESAQQPEAARVQAESVPTGTPTTQTAETQEVVPTPAPAVQTPPTPPEAPALQQQVAPQTQPTVQQEPVTQSQPAVSDSGPIQQTILDPFDAALKNVEKQGEKRMLEALAAKPAIYSSAGFHKWSLVPRLRTI